MKTVFKLYKNIRYRFVCRTFRRKEDIMGSKAPYQTKQMAQLLSYLRTVEGTHVTVADVCLHFKVRGLRSERRQFTVIWRRWWSRGWSPNTMWTGRAVPVLNISEQRNTVTRPPVSTVNVKNVENSSIFTVKMWLNWNSI